MPYVESLSITAVGIHDNYESDDSGILTYGNLDVAEFRSEMRAKLLHHPDCVHTLLNCMRVKRDDQSEADTDELLFMLLSGHQRATLDFIMYLLPDLITLKINASDSRIRSIGSMLHSMITHTDHGTRPFNQLSTLDINVFDSLLGCECPLWKIVRSPCLRRLKAQNLEFRYHGKFDTDGWTSTLEEIDLRNCLVERGGLNLLGNLKCLTDIRYSHKYNLFGCNSAWITEILDWLQRHAAETLQTLEFKGDHEEYPDSHQSWPRLRTFCELRALRNLKFTAELFQERELRDDNFLAFIRKLLPSTDPEHEWVVKQYRNSISCTPKYTTQSL